MENVKRMTKESRLIKDTIIYAIGNFGAKILSFLMLPIYTAYFTTAEYGQWDIITTSLSMVIPFITFELVSACYRWLLSEKNIRKRKSIFTTSFLYIMRNVVVFDLIYLIGTCIFDIKYSLYILLLINTSILLSFIQQSIRGLGNNKLFVYLGFFNTLLSFGLNIYFMFGLELRVEAFFFSTILSNLLISLFAWKRAKLYDLFSIEDKSVSLYKDFIKYSLPLIPSAISWWVMNVSDRYFIVYYLGVEKNGLYSIANKIPALLLIFSSIFMLAWKDNVLKEYESEDKNIYYSNIFNYYSRFMIGVIIILISSSQILIKLLVSNDFIEAWRYSNLLLVGTLFSEFAQFWAIGYHGSKQTKSIFYTSSVGSIINIIINIAIIQKFGLYAATISTIISFIIMWLIRVYDKKKDFSIYIDRKRMISLLLILSIFLILSYIKITIINILVIIASILSFIIINFKLIRSIILNIKNRSIGK